MDSHKASNSRSSVIRTLSWESGFSSLSDEDDMKDSQVPSQAWPDKEILERSTDHEKTHPLREAASSHQTILKENANLRHTLTAILERYTKLKQTLVVREKEITDS